MKNFLKILILLFLTSFIPHQNLLANNPVPLGGDTLVWVFNCEIDNFANPFALVANPGDFVKFKAISGEFSILIRNASSFFENVGYFLIIHIDSNGIKAPMESNTFTVKSNLTADFEIKMEVLCITSGGWATAPPRIIIVPSD
ncbi:MAG: hypothetical protein OEM46_07860 [Ignavibacteria bacterium]|nr:hypothetical protein [Ignavibacteria bacterium]